MHTITMKWFWLFVKKQTNDFDSLSKTTLILWFSAILKSHIQVVLRFQDGHIALHLAVRRCQIEVVKTLISQGCFVDFQDRHGNAPLHVACKDGNVPIVMTLCEAGCNLDVANKVGGILEYWYWTTIFKSSPTALDDLFYLPYQNIFSSIFFLLKKPTAKH